MLVEHGFSPSDILELVYGGFATPRAERVANQTRELDISYLRITEAGREALERQWRPALPRALRSFEVGQNNFHRPQLGIRVECVEDHSTFREPVFI